MTSRAAVFEKLLAVIGVCLRAAHAGKYYDCSENQDSCTESDQESARRIQGHLILQPILI
jgi:hypothetical protein